MIRGRSKRPTRAIPLPPARPAAYHASRPVRRRERDLIWAGRRRDSMAQQSPGLQRNAIGLTEVLFQSITFMAPAVAVALSIGFATTYALGLTPLAVVLALVA